MLHRHSLPRIPGLAIAALVTGGLVLACGSNSANNPDGGDGTGNGIDGGGGGGLLGGGNNGGVNGLGDAACATQTSRAQGLPLDIYIMLDQSGSMKENVSGGQTKWVAVTNALDAFVTQPNLNGISVGLQYFGLPPGSAGGGGGGGGCTNGKACTGSADCPGGACLGVCLCLPAGGGGPDSCVAADYAKPEVEIAPLPGSSTAITASIKQHGPSSSTPTSAALQGAVDHASAWAKAHTQDVVIALLATDGDPTECDTNLANIDAIAAKAAAANPKVLTFVIGVGPSSAALNGIAKAGGTNAAFIVDTNANAQQQFLDALNQIRGAALGCTYSIPVPSSGVPDFGSVNVEYVPGGGGAPVLIPKVSDPSQCPATGNAWYYDNNAAPTHITLCDATCKTIEADKGGQVQVLLGCASVVK